MSTRHDTIHLSERECWSLLERNAVARLAVDVGGRPDIFPINYVIDGASIVFRTGAGTKLAGAVLGRHVAIEIDGLDDQDRSVWSVVVKGIAREVDDMGERFVVEDLPLYPWVASHKPNFVRIEPELTTGRRFHVVESDGSPSKMSSSKMSLETSSTMSQSEMSDDHHPGEPQMRPG